MLVRGRDRQQDLAGVGVWHRSAIQWPSSRQFTQSMGGPLMATTLQISGTPAEIYQRHMVPAIFARWAPDLVKRPVCEQGKARSTSRAAQAPSQGCWRNGWDQRARSRAWISTRVCSRSPDSLLQVRTSNGWKAVRSRCRYRMRPSTLWFASRDSNSFLRSRRPSQKCAECSGAAAALRCPAGARSNTLRAISCLSRPWLAESVPKRRRSHRSAWEMQERSEACS